MAVNCHGNSDDHDIWLFDILIVEKMFQPLLPRAGSGIYDNGSLVVRSHSIPSLSPKGFAS
jgi:hypothetical protein